uniref:Uncharacterized protein n=1 Tax=Arundo donax TaxID=35708 RepID=A0A0A9QC71_ARUDO
MHIFFEHIASVCSSHIFALICYLTDC